MAVSKDEMLARMAAHVLVHGLNQATLRPLALAAGTSDRMLIYHFGSKEGLVGALVDHLAVRMTAQLDAAPVPPAATPELLAATMAGLVRAPEARPFAAVWLEVVAGASRGIPGYGEAAARILLHFHAWLVPRLPAGIPDPTAAAARALALIEGALVLSAAGAEGTALADAALSSGPAADR